jgi:DNA-3-methyladenine glycosylase
MVAYALMNPASQNLYTWLTADALTVAPQLLGWELISHAGGADTGGRIVELEAYHGSIDPASHAYRGLTPRTAPMFEAGGAIYVYLSYGIHTCLNLVTGPAGEAQALLIRALEPTRGLDVMATRRHLPWPLSSADHRRLARGPGSLGQALGITRALSGTHLGEVLELRPPQTPLDPAAHTKELLEGKNVRLEPDPTDSDRDKYHRLLRYVYLPDSTLINAALIRDGYAFAYTVFPLTKLDDFRALEAEARQNNRGLWAGCNIDESQQIKQTTGSK